MKKLIPFLLVSLTALAQEYTSVVTTGGTPVSVLAEPVAVKQITLTATSSSATTFVFYDTAGTSTNYVRPQYVRPVSYSTNFTTVYTNTYGIVITNTFTGIWVTTETVPSANVERQRLWRFVIPGNTTRTVDVADRRLLNGLLTLSSANGIVEVEYER